MKVKNKMLFKVSMFLLVASIFFLAPYVKFRSKTRRPSSSCKIGCEVHNSSEYVIYTPGCIIPDFDPYHPSMVNYWRRTMGRLKLVCSTKSPLTEISGLFLLFIEERLHEYGSSAASVQCYYRGIRRIEQKPDQYNRDCDSKFELRHKIHINATKTLIEDDGIVVICEDKVRNISIYKDVHYFIQPRRAQEKIMKFKVEVAARGKRPERLSVIIMGTDSVSRGNLKRHMPKTFNYLKNDLQAIDLQGYNKIGDNTNPNVVAMLMGFSYSDLDRFLYPKTKMGSKFDDCPLIWKDFSKKGYVTAYGEDSPAMGSFHFNRYGFVKEPTDYYNRPHFLVSDMLIGHKGTLAHPCQGTRWSMKLIHKMSSDMAEAMRDVPHFGFYWISSVTHDFMNNAALADQPSLEYLQKLHEGGSLEHAVLFFISDHGMRYGEFRKTYPGLIEERMPYAIIRFPDWFREQYPEAVKNLETNTRRLTSTFDLHVTLRDILNQDYARLNESARPSKHGQSLFREVPSNRTCGDASIPDHYCACQHTKEVELEDPHLEEAAKAVLKELNDGLQAFPSCSHLSLDKVVGGRVGEPMNGTKPHRDDATLVTPYMVTFTTHPGGGVLEATVKYVGGEYTLTSDVSRISRYGNQSHCITDSVYKKYCFCIDLL